MALINKRVGAPVLISIGRRGEQPDFYAGRIVSPPQVVIGQNGRPQEMCTVIYHAKNLAEEDYLAERLHSVAFMLDRDERDELVDGTEEAPKDWKTLVQEKTLAFIAFSSSLAPRGQTVTAEDLGV